MNKLKLIALSVTTSTLLSGCGGDIAAVVASVTGIATPASVVVIASGGTSGNLAAVNYAAFNDAGTDYSNTVAETWIDGGDWQEPINMADDLACVMAASNAGNHPNEQYTAMIQDSTCFGTNTNAGQINWASAVIDSSRVDINSDHLVKAYYTVKEGTNTNTIVADVVAKSAPSTTNPWGEWSMNFDFKNLTSPLALNGSLSVADNDGDIAFQYIDTSTLQAECRTTACSMWANGILKSNKSGGEISAAMTWAGTTTNYKVDFNTNYAAVSVNGGTASCQDLTNMTEYAFQYNLYSTAGALVPITAMLELVYDTNKDKRAYVGQYRSGGTAASPTYTNWVWTEDGTQPTTVYLASNNTIAKTINWSSAGVPTVAGITLDPPIIFNNNHASNDALGSSDLFYVATGSLYGFSWSQDGSGNWYPGTSLADGAQLTASNGTNYIVKRTAIGKVPPSVSVSNCTGLDPSTITYAQPTALTSAQSINWTDQPTVSSVVTVKHGVDQ